MDRCLLLPEWDELGALLESKGGAEELDGLLILVLLHLLAADHSVLPRELHQTPQLQRDSIRPELPIRTGLRRRNSNCKRFAGKDSLIMTN